MLEMYNSMYGHTYVCSGICMNNTTILSTYTAPPAYALKYTTVATDMNTCFAPILPSLKQTMYCPLSHSM